jgi:hypothetical protein
VIDCCHHSAFAAAIKFAPRLWKEKPPQGGFFMPEPYADVRYRPGAHVGLSSKATLRDLRYTQVIIGC